MKTNCRIIRLRPNSKPYNLSVDDELAALEGLLESAVQREKYELAALIKNGIDKLNVNSTWFVS